MSPPTETLQRIARLAPLSDALARLERLAPAVPTRSAALSECTGLTLAADVLANRAEPAGAIALRDGWAVASERVLDAGPYSPVPLQPPPVWVETGETMPAGTDTVLAPDAVTMKRGTEAVASAAPGEGVLAAAAHAGPGEVLARAGQRLRPTDVAVLALAGFAEVPVREPCVSLVHAAPAAPASDAVCRMLARLMETDGARVRSVQADSLESALLDGAADATVSIGGTGAGRRDAAVKTLARIGRVELHGIGISPGETTAIGRVESRPVLMLPGRPDAALAAFLVLGRRLLALLAGRNDDEPTIPVTLVRKVTSNLGMAEVVLVRRTSGGVEPLASDPFTWGALVRANGWLLVPPESEGFAAQTRVEMRPL